MQARQADELKNLFGDRLSLEVETLERYSRDETSHLQAMPEAVVFAEDTQDIARLLRFCTKNNVSVTPRGLGTGVSGGALPARGGVVLSMERMNRILEIDTDNRMAVVQPGVITGELQEAVEEKGLFYPPDPASLDSCSIGGNVIEGAGGPRAVKYGTTKDYVTGLEFVIPTGDILRVGGKLRKNVTGYNLIGIMIASEGTLGVVTEITLRLLPLPAVRTDLLVPFESFRKAAHAINEIHKTGITPVVIEFMERRALEIVETYLDSKLPVPGAGAYLMLGLDGPDPETIERDYERVGDVCLENGAVDVFVAETTDMKERLWKTRRSLHDALHHLSSEMEREDVVVPVARIEDLLMEVDKIRTKTEVEVVAFGHAGDGNVHINLLRGKLEEKVWKAERKRILAELFKLVISLGGTLSGEHGIGLVKKEFMPLVASSAELELYKRLKQAFDPAGILNPGKII
ncbi:FAD-binding protein [candidate division WOR-3 bacterium]|nr:FAD-binding protein [candidate division WOR-3 bacterium]